MGVFFSLFFLFFQQLSGAAAADGAESLMDERGQVCICYDGTATMPACLYFSKRKDALKKEPIDFKEKPDPLLRGISAKHIKALCGFFPDFRLTMEDLFCKKDLVAPHVVDIAVFYELLENLSSKKEDFKHRLEVIKSSVAYHFGTLINIETTNKSSEIFASMPLILEPTKKWYDIPSVGKVGPPLFHNELKNAPLKNEEFMKKIGDPSAQHRIDKLKALFTDD